MAAGLVGPRLGGVALGGQAALVGSPAASPVASLVAGSPLVAISGVPWDIVVYRDQAPYRGLLTSPRQPQAGMPSIRAEVEIANRSTDQLLNVSVGSVRLRASSEGGVHRPVTFLTDRRDVGGGAVGRSGLVAAGGGGGSALNPAPPVGVPDWVSAG